MTRAACLVVICSVFAIRASGEVLLEQQKDRWVLQNEFVSAEIMPASSGRITSLKLKPTGEEFLEVLEENVRSVSPLVPEQIKSNNAGYKDLLWREPVPLRVPFEVLESRGSPQRGVLILQGKVGAFEVTREISLVKGSAVIEQKITVHNRQPTERELNYWGHILLNPAVFLASGKGLAALHSRAGGQIIRSKVTEVTRSPGVQAMEVEPGYFFLSTSERWLARIAPVSGSMLILRVSPECLGPETMFSIWQSDAATSMEFVMEPRSIGPGESLTFTIDLALLPKAGQPLCWIGNLVLCREEERVEAVRVGNASDEVLLLPGRDGRSREIPLVGARTLEPLLLGADEDFAFGEAVLEGQYSEKVPFQPEATPLHLKSIRP